MSFLYDYLNLFKNKRNEKYIKSLIEVFNMLPGSILTVEHEQQLIKFFYALRPIAHEVNIIKIIKIMDKKTRDNIIEKIYNITDSYLKYKIKNVEALKSFMDQYGTNLQSNTIDKINEFLQDDTIIIKDIITFFESMLKDIYMETN